MSEQQSGSTVFVDTSAYAALVLTSDSNHLRAVAITRALEQRRMGLVTTNYVVAETYALILARSGRSIAISMLDRFEESDDLVVRVSEDDERRSYQIVRGYQDKTFSLVDATSFAVMERLGLTEVFTFDRHFAQYGLQLTSTNNE